MLPIAQSSSRSAARLLRTQAPSLAQRRCASGGGPSYNQPTGNLFGEKPLPKGQKRKWEDWELIWYIGMFGSLAVAAVGTIFKPDTSLNTWAMAEARKNLEASGKTWKYEPSPYSGYDGKNGDK